MAVHGSVSLQRQTTDRFEQVIMPRIAVSLSSAIVAVAGLLQNVVAQETYDEPQVIEKRAKAPGQPTSLRPSGTG